MHLTIKVKLSFNEFPKAKYFGGETTPGKKKRLRQRLGQMGGWRQSFVLAKRRPLATYTRLIEPVVAAKKHAIY